MPIDKPSQQEEEFFIKLEAEKIKKLRQELDKKREEESKQRQKDSNWMRCPKCGSSLEEIKYQEVMIDRCQNCKGIWLDHGELELLAEGKASFTKGILSKIFG
ncbi:MAG: zf-TFIIB domain-containing protein [Candidatus Bathyarchaeia archaeon]